MPNGTSRATQVLEHRSPSPQRAEAWFVTKWGELNGARPPLVLEQTQVIAAVKTNIRVVYKARSPLHSP